MKAETIKPNRKNVGKYNIVSSKKGFLKRKKKDQKAQKRVIIGRPDYYQNEGFEHIKMKN